jgi:hypothetical protein
MRAAGIVVPLLLLVGMVCNCSSSSTKPETIFGLYQLQSVDGSPMPYVVLEEDDVKLEIVSGSLLLKEDFRFTTDWTMKLTAGDVSDTEHDINVGTFEQNGSELTFSFHNGPTFPGTINGRTVTVNDQGIVYVYVKP